MRLAGAQNYEISRVVSLSVLAVEIPEGMSASGTVLGLTGGFHEGHPLVIDEPVSQVEELGQVALACLYFHAVRILQLY